MEKRQWENQDHWPWVGKDKIPNVGAHFSERGFRESGKEDVVSVPGRRTLCPGRHLADQSLAV